MNFQFTCPLVALPSYYVAVDFASLHKINNALYQDLSLYFDVIGYQNRVLSILSVR